METFLQQFQDLKIQKEEITSATNNFDDKNYIGGGGFGKVFKGEVSHSKGRSIVAIKRLDPGTIGYCDPQYAMTHTLTKESDVYSFGVVLFEVLCGALCYRYSIDHVPQTLVPMWIESYQQNKLNDIIFKSSNILPMDQCSLKTFSDIAYQCLKESREDRPKMAEVVAKLETALESQEFSEWKPPFDYEDMTKTAEPPLNYSSIGELRKLLSKGVVLNGGKTCFSLNKKGEHSEMISFVECVDLEFKGKWSSEYNSRFGEAVQLALWRLRIHSKIQSQLVSSQTTYASYLVYKLPKDQSDFKPPVKVEDKEYLGSDHIWYIYLVSPKTPVIGPKVDQNTHNPVNRPKIKGLPQQRNDGWMEVQIWEFQTATTTNNIMINFELTSCGDSIPRGLIIQGVEFRPI
ncbi:hypothetical protein L1987_74140 [Smallanthus sonchifolius]|uniref:Uncharacterized protein n=1 Tax=Smallanthus sonchifolius TaxID=185202 RepID=A0ACB9A295_9ASTR|nr:hypothetical protein L1987_74140 [Smallanthus sonchifolius]